MSNLSKYSWMDETSVWLYLWLQINVEKTKTGLLYIVNEYIRHLHFPKTEIKASCGVSSIYGCKQIMNKRNGPSSNPEESI